MYFIIPKVSLPCSQQQATTLYQYINHKQNINLSSTAVSLIQLLSDYNLSITYSLPPALLVERSRDRSPVVSLGIFSEASDKPRCPGSTQPLKMSTRIFLGLKAAGDDLTTFMCRVSRNLGALTSWTPPGHVGL